MLTSYLYLLIPMTHAKISLAATIVTSYLYLLMHNFYVNSSDLIGCHCDDVISISTYSPLYQTELISVQVSRTYPDKKDRA